KNAKTQANAKGNKAVKEQVSQREEWKETLLIIAAIGGVLIGVLAYYHAQTPLIWVTFLTVCTFLFALHLRWRRDFVTRLCVLLAVIVFISCVIWQIRIGQGELETRTPAPTPVPSPTEPPLRGVLL